MSVIIQGSQLRQIDLGIRVEKGPVTNPQTASTALFTVTGGKVAITSLVGIVTTVQGATANSFNLTYTPSGGSAADISAATVCTSDAAGTYYTITGVAADLVSAQKVGGTEVPTVTYAPTPTFLTGALVVGAGALNLKASGSNTGATTWVLTYVPIDDGAAIAAA
jgi:hypothetical protein